MGLAAVLYCSLSICGCAPKTYRLAPPLLIPPQVAHASLTRRVLHFDSKSVQASCWESLHGVAVRARRGGLQVQVDRDLLAVSPAGWLLPWAAQLQTKGCLGVGEANGFAELVAGSLPLPLGVADRLLHPDTGAAGYIDLRPGNWMRVLSPILRAGAAPGSSAIEAVEGTQDGQLSVTARSSANLLGYEIAWYTLTPVPQGGAKIEPLGAESHLGDTVEKSATSRFPYFHLDPAAVFQRVLFLTRASASDRDSLFLAARSEAQLETDTAALRETPALCQSEKFRSRCIVLPQQVALLVFVTVSLQGQEITTRSGTTLGALIGQNTKENPELLVPRLQVSKRFWEKQIPVQFDPHSAAILGLPLGGGEKIFW